jgi:hypothetical protein
MIQLEIASLIIQSRNCVTSSIFMFASGHDKDLNVGLNCKLQAGWKLWPFAHLITYGVVPVEQRLLWVDCVELIWVTILST